MYVSHGFCYAYATVEIYVDGRVLSINQVREWSMAVKHIALGLAVGLCVLNGAARATFRDDTGAHNRVGFVCYLCRNSGADIVWGDHCVHKVCRASLRSIIGNAENCVANRWQDDAMIRVRRIGQLALEAKRLLLKKGVSVLEVDRLANHDQAEIVGKLKAWVENTIAHP